MAIKVKNLTKYYGEVKALDDISFEVKKGEILGFLGPNGAGKTTTMKIITCYLTPTAGDVELDGLNVQQHSLQIRSKIGYLPEQNPLYLDMNVIDYLEFAAQLNGVKKEDIPGRIRAMIDVCGLGDVKHRDIGELSKGFRQRVGLGQAMIHSPEFLILDEPTIGLDPNQIVEIRNLIKELGKEKTVVLSTHILPEVQSTCNRVLIINEGKIVADGTTEELRQQFVAGEIIKLEIKADVQNPLESIFPHLKSLASVQTVEMIEHVGNIFSMNVHSSKGADVREAVFQTAIAQGWVLLEMHRQTTSLEEVFHKLTT
jgi:ABC-2 type transport system ATP-binding protein